MHALEVRAVCKRNKVWVRLEGGARRPTSRLLALASTAIVCESGNAFENHVE